MGIVLNIASLAATRAGLRDEGKRVVFTNGVFDIIHRGHVEYLSRARELGDILIVGMNSDASVRRIKGEKRPIVCEEDRAYVVASLGCVDYVALFEEDTPLALITRIVPDVLVKGADWSLDAIVGKEVVEQAGGVVSTIAFIPHRSTSNIIDEILKRYT
jgi:D-beta-D-heptose 7-phosphate kinase/D-beta-D-heptose 1-phosphate adenosyltransferase